MFAILLLLLSATPSFSCTAANTKIEKAICADPALADKDRKVAAAYGAAIKTVPPSDLAAFRQNQRDWLLRRAAGCGSAPIDYGSCIGYSYDARLTELQHVIRSPVKGLSDLLWTDGVVCAGNKALIRFEDHGDRGFYANSPPHIGGPLARAIGNPSQCKLADGRLVRFKTAFEDDLAPRGECSADNSEIYSVWIGSDKIFSREKRAGHCDDNAVRAIFFDGHHLMKCAEDVRREDDNVSSECRNISSRLGRSIRDRFPSGQFIVTYAASGMRPFCETMIHSIPPTDDDAGWPRKSAAPSAAITLKGDKFDLTNSGRPQHVIRFEYETDWGSFFMIAPRSMTAAATRKVTSDDDLDAAKARKLGFQVFAGDRTPYKGELVDYTAFRKNNATWFYVAPREQNTLQMPSAVIMKPQPDGSQKLVCTYQTAPDL